MGNGKFINKQHKDLIEKLTDTTIDRLQDNNYYQFNDKKPTLVTYYSVDTKASSYDKNLEQEYSDIGKRSPIKYNKILELPLYGDFKINPDFNPAEQGLEADEISGEFTILPDTIIPQSSDFFSIDYLDTKLLFKVDKPQVNTMIHNKNFYNIQFHLERLTDKDIEKQVINTYICMMENIGKPNYNVVIKQDNYNFIDILDNTLSFLKEYYKTLFYSDRVQCFVYDYGDDYIYDPYCIEFIMKHDLISTTDKYLYICQQITLPKTFSLDYAKSIFRATENCDKRLNRFMITSQCSYIEDLFSVFSVRCEDYFKVNYNALRDINKDTITILDTELVDKIQSNEKYEYDKELKYRNVIIKYFNNEIIVKEDIECLESIQFTKSITLFYELILVIYILEYTAKNILKK